ncbi:hypothetical protein [Mesoplasma florum]|uniref:hypothetical protein n=1 Tax=Mesoplasma florum TaxID=2151 RepID=UPI000D0309BE|nr:hypothetical protein [Mesoplasma florum]AVN58865.1 hypothetical protein CG009_01315 [Mesoplasma florum]
MTKCNLCKLDIKPYQLRKKEVNPSQTQNNPHMSNFGFTIIGARVMYSHLGCYNLYYKKNKYWTWIGALIAIIGIALFIPGFFHFFNSVTDQIDPQTNDWIINHALRKQGMIELICAACLIIGSIIIITIGNIYAKKFIKDGSHANDFIDEKIKIEYYKNIDKEKNI